MRSGQPYPATFQVPYSRASGNAAVDSPGVEPGPPPRQGGVLPLDHEPKIQRSVRESNPVCRLTKAECFRNTYRPNLTIRFIQCPRWESNPQNHQALDLAAFPFAYSDVPSWAGERVDGRK